MTLGEVRRALGDTKAFLAWDSVEKPDRDDAECAYLQTKRLPHGLRPMFQRGLLVRIDVDASGLRTRSGIGVGDTEARIGRVYEGHLTIEPHRYTFETGGHYVNYRPFDDADKGYGMVFETHKGRVTQFRIGTLAAIALVERCS